MKKSKTVKLLSIFLSLILIITCLPVSTFAEGNTEDYDYELLEDGAIEITGYKGSDTEIKIPAEIDGKKVQEIGQYAFEDCSSLTSVSIPSIITSIGYGAFRSCSG